MIRCPLCGEKVRGEFCEREGCSERPIFTEIEADWPRLHAQMLRCADQFDARRKCMTAADRGERPRRIEGGVDINAFLEAAKVLSRNETVASTNAGIWWSAS